jgi:hypothetical protein
MLGTRIYYKGGQQNAYERFVTLSLTGQSLPDAPGLSF